MKIYTNQYYRIGLRTTKNFLFIKDLKTETEIKIDTRNIIKAYQIKNNLLLNSSTVLNRTLYFLNKDLTTLKNEVLNNEKQFNSIIYLQDKAKEIKNKFFKEYHKVSIFKNLLNL